MNNRNVLVALFIFCTGLLTLLTFPLTTIAAPGDQWARWTIHVAFANNQPDVEMLIEIGHEGRSGSQIIDISETFTLDCQDHGSLEITNNAAKFDGNSYLQCEMPNFQEKVAELTGGELLIGDECNCKQANGEADFTFSTNSENPFFYLPDLQFSAPTNASGLLAQYRLMVSGQVAESEPFATAMFSQEGGGEFLFNGSGYNTEFHVNGLGLGSSPSFIAGTLAMPTSPTEFFIGYNADTGSTLQGELRTLTIDPGCVGHGGI